MASTVKINRLTGSGPTATDITGINTRANAEDAHSTAGTTNSILIPAAGTNNSYWVVTQLNVTSGISGTVDNLRWHTDGTNNFGTGITCVGNTATGYVQATGTAGTSGTTLNTTNYATLTGAPVDVFGFTSGSPKTVSGSTTTTGLFGDRFVYQMQIASTASAGATGTETFTWKYDDTTP